MSFKAGGQIRCLTTGKLYLVVQKFKCAVLVSDLESGQILNEPKLIVERDWDKFAEDLKCEREKFGEDLYKWRQFAI